MIHKLLNGRKVVLASASPRRKELFKLVGIKALQMPPHINESCNYRSPVKFVNHLAEKKAKAIAKLMDNDCVIVAADTIVFFNGEILNKPQNQYQAAEFLTALSDHDHYVYTGVCVISGVGLNNISVQYEKTRVTFKHLDLYEISEYIESGEPFDKAGAYGIQGLGSQFIKKINGCYFNVMGFPLPLFYDMLKQQLGKV